MKSCIKDNKIRNLSFMQIFMFFAPFAIGGYYIVVSSIYTGILLFYAVTKVIKSDCKTNYILSFATASICLFSIMYLITVIWAVDRGTAIYGFIKFLPVAIFALLISQNSQEQRENILEVIPYSAIAMTILSFPLSRIPTCSDFFLVADRLSGFFQYPNAFALYSLIGIVIIGTKTNHQWSDLFLSIPLLFAVFLSGSRTVFVLLAITILVFILKPGKTKIKVLIIVISAIFIICILFYVFISKDKDAVGRFLTISIKSSTLLGRILYWKDAIGVILKYPFGLGYYGYYYMQGSFQTGVYSVVNAHNEYLQLLLDIGFIPALAFLSTLVFSLFSKNTSFRKKLILILIAAHSFFDFDFQFVSILFVLTLTLDYSKLILFSIKVKYLVVTASSLLLILLSTYFGIVNTEYLLNNYDVVEQIYGADTQSEIQLIINEEDYGVMEYYADSIIKRNKYITLAYDVKANVELSKGNFREMVEYKKKAVNCSKYDIVEYEDFCRKLMIGLTLYKQNNDKQGEAFCKEEILKVPEILSEVISSTDSLGWKIQDKPNLVLSEEISEYIKALK